MFVRVCVCVPNIDYGLVLKLVRKSVFVIYLCYIRLGLMHRALCESYCLKALVSSTIYCIFRFGKKRKIP